MHTPESLSIAQQPQEVLKEHYQNHKTKRDEYPLSKKNLELDPGDEEKVNEIRITKRALRCNQCYRSFKFNKGIGISAQEINQI